MNLKSFFRLSVFFSVLLLSQGCIHEYPKGGGNDPNKIDLGLELNFNLNWESMIHQVEWSTRARTERPNRFIIEMMRNNNIIGRDTLYLTDEEYVTGKYQHKLSFPVGANYYNLVAWYDRFEEGGVNPVFNTDNLTAVSLNHTGIENVEITRSAFGSENIDLSEYRGKKGVAVTKEVNFRHPGARFVIETEDYQEFLLNQKEALNQGDSFRIKINFDKDGPALLNLYSDKIDYDFGLPSREGKLNLPFIPDENLEIAEGFLFCSEEDYITMSIIVYNSALLQVARTDNFTFPVKRGFITRIKGDFLTAPINSSIKIDHIWEGEIIVEVEV